MSHLLFPGDLAVLDSDSDFYNDVVLLLCLTEKVNREALGGEGGGKNHCRSRQLGEIRKQIKAQVVGGELESIVSV